MFLKKYYTNLAAAYLSVRSGQAWDNLYDPQDVFDSFNQISGHRGKEIAECFADPAGEISPLFVFSALNYSTGFAEPGACESILTMSIAGIPHVDAYIGENHFSHYVFSICAMF